MESKVMLVQAIRRQEEGSLAREVLEEQLGMGFPGIGQEVSSICEEVGLPDACRMDLRLNHLVKLKAELSEKKN